MWTSSRKMKKETGSKKEELKGQRDTTVLNAGVVAAISSSQILKRVQR